MTPEYLKTRLSYDPETGVFTWLKVAPNMIKRLRKPAGSVRKATCGKMYHQIQVGGGHYHTHRLAWFYVHGEWPKYFIDHINGDGLDNRICNLRDCTRTSNAQNHLNRKPGKSGLSGAIEDRGRFYPSIRVDGKIIKMGGFATALEAHEAYIEARTRLHDCPGLKAQLEG